MQFAGMIFVKSGIFEHAIYSCTPYYDGEIKINNMLKRMKFVETSAIKVNLISIDDTLYSEHTGTTSATISETTMEQDHVLHSRCNIWQTVAVCYTTCSNDATAPWFCFESQMWTC